MLGATLIYENVDRMFSVQATSALSRTALSRIACAAHVFQLASSPHFCMPPIPLLGNTCLFYLKNTSIMTTPTRQHGLINASFEFNLNILTNTNTSCLWNCQVLKIKVIIQTIIFICMHLRLMFNTQTVGISTIESNRWRPYPLTIKNRARY